jgi:hypothetical protein
MGHTFVRTVTIDPLRPAAIYVHYQVLIVLIGEVLIKEVLIGQVLIGQVLIGQVAVLIWVRYSLVIIGEVL